MLGSWESRPEVSGCNLGNTMAFEAAILASLLQLLTAVLRCITFCLFLPCHCCTGVLPCTVVFNDAKSSDHSVPCSAQLASISEDRRDALLRFKRKRLDACSEGRASVPEEDRQKALEIATNELACSLKQKGTLLAQATRQLRQIVSSGQDSNTLWTPEYGLTIKPAPINVLK